MNEQFESYSREFPARGMDGQLYYSGHNLMEADEHFLEICMNINYGIQDNESQTLNDVEKD